jgi:hypothetical protein
MKRIRSHVFRHWPELIVLLAVLVILIAFFWSRI